MIKTIIVGRQICIVPRKISVHQAHRYTATTKLMDFSLFVPLLFVSKLVYPCGLTYLRLS